MIVELNGRPTELSDEATVLTAVTALDVGVARRGIAVAVGAEVVPRSQWEARRLHEGDRLEVVSAIQGG